MLTFNAEKHEYAFDGKPLDGVTTVIRQAGLMPEYSPKDAEWYMQRGSMIHLATELYDNGLLDESSVDSRIMGYLESWEKYPDHEWIGIEARLCDPVYMYAGTLDRIPLLDIKSGSPVAWHKIQLGAYFGLCKANGIRVEKGTAVYLQEDGSHPKVITYSLPELIDGLKTFHAALLIVRSKKEMKLI